MNIFNKIMVGFAFVAALGSGCRAQEGGVAPSRNDGEIAGSVDGFTLPHYTLEGYGLYDFHYATGSVGGGALTFGWRVSEGFGLKVGLEYVSSNRISGKLEGQARLWNTKKGYRLCLENSYLWRHYPSLEMQEFTGALQLGWYARHVTLHLGLCNRYTANLVQRSNDAEEMLFEPMNVMFAVEGWWNNNLYSMWTQGWNVGLRWSNYNDFIIERVANWFFSVKGCYRLDPATFLEAEVGVHPVGSLNLTASYDGWFMHLGAVRRF